MNDAVRLLETPAEIAATEELQRAVWPGSDLEIVPAHVLITAAHNGGLVAGAFAGERLAGFVWGFLGWDDRADPPRLKHCSHMLGVHPAFRNRGLGEALKRFQFEHVQRQGLRLITWTYDPLLARNAQLNIARLGAVCNTYLRDAYGRLGDELNAGLITDRFQVDWWIDAPAARPAGEPDTVRYEIPEDLLALKRADPARALAWRLESREMFETLFAAGYTVTGFERGAGRAAYILQRARDTSPHAY